MQNILSHDNFDLVSQSVSTGVISVNKIDSIYHNNQARTAPSIRIQVCQKALAASALVGCTPGPAEQEGDYDVQITAGRCMCCCRCRWYRQQLTVMVLKPNSNINHGACYYRATPNKMQPNDISLDTTRYTLSCLCATDVIFIYLQYSPIKMARSCGENVYLIMQM